MTHKHIQNLNNWITALIGPQLLACVACVENSAELKKMNKAKKYKNKKKMKKNPIQNRSVCVYV